MVGSQGCSAGAQARKQPRASAWRAAREVVGGARSYGVVVGRMAVLTLAGQAVARGWLAEVT